VFATVNAEDTRPDVVIQIDEEEAAIHKEQGSKTGVERTHAFMRSVGSGIIFEPDPEHMSVEQWIYAYQMMDHLHYVPVVNLKDMTASDFTKFIVGTGWENMATRVTAESWDWEPDIGGKLKAAVLESFGKQDKFKKNYSQCGQPQQYWTAKGRSTTCTVTPHVDKSSTFHLRFTVTFTEDGECRWIVFSNIARRVKMRIPLQSGSGLATSPFSSGNTSHLHPLYAERRPNMNTEHSVPAGKSNDLALVFDILKRQGDDSFAGGGIIMQDLRDGETVYPLDHKPFSIPGLSTIVPEPGTCAVDSKFSTAPSLYPTQRKRTLIKSFCRAHEVPVGTSKEWCAAYGENFEEDLQAYAQLHHGVAARMLTSPPRNFRHMPRTIPSRSPRELRALCKRI
jgi:hypothetical protein